MKELPPQQRRGEKSSVQASKPPHTQFNEGLASEQAKRLRGPGRAALPLVPAYS